jgi:hypothetical protein
MFISTNMSCEKEIDMPGIENNKSIIYHVSTSGFDGWNGLISEANEAGTDGPFATVAGARDKIRILRKNRRPIAEAEDAREHPLV